MPHVLHADSLNVGPGGQTLRLVEEARRLNARPGWTCSVAGRSGGPLEPFLAGESWFVPFRFPRFRHHPGAITGAVRLIRRLEADVVHTHSSEDAWIFGIAARLAGVPIVRGRHVTRPLHAVRIQNAGFLWLADAFTVSGASVGRILTEGGVASPEQIYDTGGGFDPVQFDADRRDPAFLTQELDLAPSARIVGAVGAVRPTKGVDILVEAVAMLQASRPELEVHGVVVGEASDADREALASRAPDCLHFLGFRSNVERVMGGMDILTMTSRGADGIPQVIPQAMALGVPVIGSRAAGVPDAIEDGVTGFLVDPDDPEGLARKVVEVLAMNPADRDRITDAARRRALERYTFDRVVDTYIRCYEWVLSEEGRVARRARHQ